MHTHQLKSTIARGFSFVVISALAFSASPLSAFAHDANPKCKEALVYSSPVPDPSGLTDSNIWIERKSQPPAQLTTYEGEDRWPAISPDGCKVAYISRRDGLLTLWVVNADGSGATQLPVPSNSQRPEWSPNGTQIAFAHDGDGFWEVWVINVDGTNLRQLTNHVGPVGDPTWSKDGQKLIYPVGDFSNSFDLYSVNVDGSGQTLVLSYASTGFSYHVPAWSPNGRWVAVLRWAAGTGGPYELWIMKADGSQGKVVASNLDSADGNNLTWSGNSRWIYFNQGNNVWKVRINGSHLTQVTNNGAIEPSISRNR